MNKLDLGPPSEQVIARIKNVWDRCDRETQKLIDDLYSYWETANMDLQVFDARLNKNWTEDSHLYTQKEVDALVEAEYSAGFDNGQSSAQQNYDGHFIR